MILYNETIGIDKDVEQQFLIWLKSHYIPEVMKTNLFSEFRIYKVLSHDDDSSTSYSVQFFSSTIEQILAFINNHSKALVDEQQRQFKDKHITFRTLLEELT
jgi:hypothetical protein